MFVGKRRVRVGALVSVAALTLGACSHGEPAKRTINEARVPVVAARRGTVTPSSTLGGIIVPLQNVQIQSTLSEPADRVSVQEGDHVTRGEVLAQLDTADLRAELQSYLGTVASDAAKIKATTLQAGLTITQNSNTINSAQASLRQAQQTLATDMLNLQRDQQLLKNGYLAQQAFDQQQTLVANDQQAVRTQEVNLQNTIAQVKTNGTTSTGLQGANVASAQADLQTALGLANQTRAMIAKATIVSPIDGVVVNRNLNPGEYPGSRQIFTLQQIDRVFAVLNGSGAQVVGVEPGSTAAIVSSDSAALHSRAKVVAVLDQLTPGSTNFVIKAVMPNPGLVFRSGMVVTGRVSRPVTAGVRVPVTAFVDDTQTTVQTIVDGAVKTVPVTMIAEDDKNAIVRGIRPGLTIISNGQLGLADGQQVAPLKGGPGGPGGRPKTVAER